jgi:hypothetical protein
MVKNIMCPICDNKELSLKMKLKADVLQCPSCKLNTAIITAKPGNTLENQNESERRKALYSLRMLNYEIIIKNLISIFNDYNKITGMEVGCAHGWFLEACNNYSKIDCMGIEPQKEYISTPPPQFTISSSAQQLKNNKWIFSE